MTTIINELGHVKDNGHRVFSPSNLPAWSQITGKPTIVESGSTVTSLSIGTLTVPSSGQILFAGSGSVGFQRSADAITTAGRFFVANTSNTSIKTTGGITAAKNVSAYSDKKLKQNISPIRDAMKRLKRVRGYNYQFKSDPTVDCLGVIAQEVKATFPQLVKDDDGILTVEYTGLIPVLLEAIKSLDARLTRLERQKRE